MSNATHGNARETRLQTFEIYDRLPPAVREALRNAFNDWATGWVARSLAQGCGVSFMLEELIASDVDEVRRDARLDWRGHADAYLAAQRPPRYRDWLDTPPKSIHLARLNHRGKP